MRRILAVLVVLALTLFVPPPSARGVPPNDIFVLYEGTTDTFAYVNGSTVEALAALNFSGNPDPPPQIDNIEFRWYDPAATLVAFESIDPDANGWALSTHVVNVEGTWSVNATYTGTPTLSRNQSFFVMPDVWGPGSVVPPGSVTVGGNASLTIAAGTRIAFDAGGRFRVKGEVTAIGTTASPILFTSNATSPLPGDWHSIIFLSESGNRSRFEEVRVSYADEGVRVLSCAPTLRNVYVADGLTQGFRITNTQTRLREVGVARTPTAFWLEGAAAEIENATMLDVTYGLLTFGGSLVLRNATVENAAQVGLDAEGTQLDLRDTEFDKGLVGLRAMNATGRGERLTFLDLDDAVIANGPSTNLAFWNSTFYPVDLHHFFLTGGASVLSVNGTFPMTGEAVSVEAGELALANFLTVRAVSYDHGMNLSGVSVEVNQSGSVAFSGTTDANGMTPVTILPYRRYAPTLEETPLRIRVTLAGYAFEDNDRTLVLNTSGTQRFRGSTFDLDGDGEPDFSDPDIDGDGIDNDGEAILGTDPRDVDTDDDGLPDGWEFGHQLDPTDASDRNLDSDEDGLTNYEEYLAGTHPKDPDTDGDGMPDGWEVDHQFDPADNADGTEDADGDGFTNLEEYRAGTDPRDPNSHPTSGGLGSLWLFLVALVVAIVVIVLSVVLGRRARRKKEQEAPPEDEAAEEDEAKPKE